MFIPIARFELAYQLRNPVLWISFGLFFLLTFGAVTVDEIQIGSGGNTLVNSPFAILQTVLIMSIFANFALVDDRDLVIQQLLDGTFQGNDLPRHSRRGVDAL